MEPQTQTLTAADLPPAVRAFWDSAPAPFKVPAILTAIDCYCALATRLRFKYTYDLDPHALLLQVLVVAEAASGKSFTRPIVKTLMQPLKLRDQEMKRIEQAYQDLKNAGAAFGKQGKSDEEVEKKNQELYAKIGKLEVMLDFAKRASRKLGIPMPADE